MKTLEEFRAFHQQTLLPILQGFETRRRDTVRKSLVALGIVAVLALGVLIVVPGVRHSGALPLVIVAAVAIGILAVVWGVLTRGFVQEFKREVIGRTVRFVDPGLNYDPAGHITQATFLASCIFHHRIDRFSGEDRVAGTVGATAVEFSELHAEYKTVTRDSKGRTQTQWHTIFRGLFFVGDFNKDFRGTTIMLPDTAERMFGLLGQKLQDVFGPSGLDLVKLEDPEFEKLFVVYGNDQVEARYILSTSLMQRIVAFRRKLDRDPCLAFVRSRVYVAIPTARDMLEPSFFASLLDVEVTEQYFRDLELAVGIVEDLNLNLRIWTKT